MEKTKQYPCCEFPDCTNFGNNESYDMVEAIDIEEKSYLYAKQVRLFCETHFINRINSIVRI